MSLTRIIREFPFEIDRRSVLRHQGYKPSSKVSDRVTEMLDEAEARAMELARPAAVWTTKPIKEISSYRVVIGNLTIVSRQIVKVMRGCVEAALFAVTVGPAIEKEAARLIETGDMAEGVMLDSVASEAVEGCADHVNLVIQHEAHRRGLHLTPRYSPGYGDWTVDHQPELFAEFDAAKAGIHLTESCMMIPRKSISAVLGLGPIGDIRTGASPCKKCSSEARKG